MYNLIDMRNTHSKKFKNNTGMYMCTNKIVSICIFSKFVKLYQKIDFRKKETDSKSYSSSCGKYLKIVC